MPKVNLGRQHLPDTQQVAKLITRYIKIERKLTVEETVTRSGYSSGLYYKRMRNPENLSLKELRAFAKTLDIPWEEMSAALSAAMQY